MKYGSLEHVLYYVEEHVIDVPVSQIRAGKDEVIWFIPTERISDYIVEQTVDIPGVQVASEKASEEFVLEKRDLMSVRQWWADEGLPVTASTCGDGGNDAGNLEEIDDGFAFLDDFGNAEVGDVSENVAAFSGSEVVARGQVSEERIVFLSGRWVTGTGGDDEYIKKSISRDGLYSPEESGNQGDMVLARRTRAGEVAGVLQHLKLLKPRSRPNVEDGNVKGGCMRSWKGELRDSGSGLEVDTRVTDEGGRRQETTTGGESKRIFARPWEEVRQVSKEELTRLTEDGSSHAYVVYGGRIETPETIDQLKDGAIVQIVNRMAGGGRKKKAASRNKGRSGMSATDESSSSTLSSEVTEVNEVFGNGAVEQMKTIAYTGQGGWIEAWARKIMEVSEEKEGEVLEFLCRAMRVEFGDVGAETTVGEIRKFIREQRRLEKDRRMKDEQEERRRHWERDEETWGQRGRLLKTIEEAKRRLWKKGKKEERGSECREDGSGRQDKTGGGERKSSKRRRSSGSERMLSRRRRGSGSKRRQRGSNDSSRRKKCGGSKSSRKRRPGEKANEGGVNRTKGNGERKKKL